MTRTIWLLLLWLMSLSSARAATIDCSHSVAPVDHVICRHKAIVQIDADLATLFQKVQARYDQPLRASLILGERRWLVLRGEACMPEGTHEIKDLTDDDGLEACLTSVYEERIRELQDLSELQTTGGQSRPAVNVEAILDDPTVLVSHRDGMYPNGDYRRPPRTPLTCRELFTLTAGIWTYGDDTRGMAFAGSAFNACSFSIYRVQNLAGAAHQEEDASFEDVMQYSTDFRCLTLGCDHLDTGTRDSFYRKGIVTTFGQEIANGDLKLEKREIPNWDDGYVQNVLIVGHNLFYIDSMVYSYEMSPPGDYTGRGRREVLMSLLAYASPGTMSIYETLVAYYDPKTGAVRPEVLDDKHPLRAVVLDH